MAKIQSGYAKRWLRIKFSRSDDAVAAVGLTSAFAAVRAHPYAVELVGGGFHERGVVGEDAGLEVPAQRAFHADAGTGEIG